jgi:hypothetical protein
MKKENFLPALSYLLICVFWTPLFSTLLGCAKPNIQMPKPLPPIVKEYKHATVVGGSPGVKNTGIYIEAGDAYSILATGSIDYWPHASAHPVHKPPPGFKYHDVRPELGWPLVVRIGEVFASYPFYNTNAINRVSAQSGHLYLGYRSGSMTYAGEPKRPEEYRDDKGAFRVDIIVWKKPDWVQIADFFTSVNKKDPGNNTVQDALADAERYKSVYLAEEQAKKEIAATEKQIGDLMKEAAQKPLPQDEQPTQASSKEDKITQLQTRLAKLLEIQNQLDTAKQELEQERKKASLLAEELGEKERREQELLTQLAQGAKNPPVIMIASPQDGSTLEANSIALSGVVEDEQGIERLEIFINNQPLEDKTLVVKHVEIRKNIWAVVVGINDYPNTRRLKYAVADAEAFYRHLVDVIQIPAENVTLLLNREARLSRLRSSLGTHLKKKAGKEDMVIIYFAGHGATEKDVLSPDGDGLEKYLLPYDVDPQDLYASALPMREISHIFYRIQSQRVIFIADSCYSGASGGRTISLSGVRANISDAFLDRIAGGKGTVIMTASGANEVSAEDEKLQHGVFTFYLLEGLTGAADADKDGLVTVDEAYRYVSTHVPRATGQEQHPVKKGTVEGRLILSITK